MTSPTACTRAWLIAIRGHSQATDAIREWLLLLEKRRLADRERAELRIGFIGGGALLKEGAGVKGTATTASIWTTGAIGAAVGYRHYEIAIVVSLTTFLTLRALTPLEKKVGKSDRKESKETSSDDSE